jgi:hypothetical protein
LLPACYLLAPGKNKKEAGIKVNARKKKRLVYPKSLLLSAYHNYVNQKNHSSDKYKRQSKASLSIHPVWHYIILFFKYSELRFLP